MTLGEVVERMIGPERLYITTEDKDIVYAGFKGNFVHCNADREAEVVKLGVFTRIYRIDRREEVLASTEGHVPIRDYISCIPYKQDLEMCVYQLIVIKKE